MFACTSRRLAISARSTRSNVVLCGRACSGGITGGLYRQTVQRRRYVAAMKVTLYHPVLKRTVEVYPQQVEHMIRDGGWERPKRKRPKKKEEVTDG